MSGDQSISASTLKLNRTVVLVGMMGCGKSAIGRSLSALLDVPFVDSDAEIESAANATIPEIFARDGEQFFRDREAEIIARLLRGEPGILSTGGGAFLRQENRDEIARHGISVWLDAPLSLLWERVRHKDTRPLLRTADPRATLEELFRERVPIYQQAGLRQPVRAGASIDQTTQSVLETLLTRPDVLEVSR